MIQIDVSRLSGSKSRRKPIIVNSEKEMHNPKKGLKYIVDDKTKILILGTFPAEESLNANFYYQNQAKRFWGQALSYVASLEHVSNQDRRKILLSKGIGLWDIFEYAERGKGNQDQAIHKAKYNEITALLDNYPSVNYLIFNGGNAYTWLKEDKPEVFNRQKLEIKRLQSSSGGNAHFNKGNDWTAYLALILS